MSFEITVLTKRYGSASEGSELEAVCLERDGDRLELLQ